MGPSPAGIVGNAIIEPIGTQNSGKKKDDEVFIAHPVHEPRQLRIVDGVKGWTPKAMEILRPESFDDFQNMKSPGRPKGPSNRYSPRKCLKFGRSFSTDLLRRLR